MLEKTSAKSKIGAHVSVANGVEFAPSRAAEIGCETFQCFTRPPQGGKAPEVTQETNKKLWLEMEKFGIINFYIHMPYYLNFASMNEKIRSASVRVAREELERGNVLGARYAITHLGSHTGQTVEEGIKKVADAIFQILDGYDGLTQLLLEISAGSGNIIGDTFDEMGEILAGLARLNLPLGGLGGVCFDTCHAFAAGYDFRSPEKARSMLEKFDEKIGLEHLKLTHVNDCKIDLGQKKDRHDHIGRGFIGEEGIASILKTPEFSKIDWILETEPEGREEDIAKLKKIRK